MRRLLATLAILALVAGALLAQPQLQQGVFLSLRSAGAINVGSLGTIGNQQLNVLSAGDNLGGGINISRTVDSAYLIINTNAGGAAGVGYIQAGDTAAYRPIILQPLGGGLKLGPGGAIVTGIVTGSVVYDAPSVADGATTATAVTVSGATTTSVCSAGITTLAGIDVVITAQASAADTVRVTLFNKTGGAVDLASGTLRAVCWNIP